MLNVSLTPLDGARGNRQVSKPGNVGGFRSITSAEAESLSSQGPERHLVDANLFSGNPSLSPTHLTAVSAALKPPETPSGLKHAKLALRALHQRDKALARESSYIEARPQDRISEAQNAVPVLREIVKAESTRLRLYLAGVRQMCEELSRKCSAHGRVLSEDTSKRLATLMQSETKELAEKKQMLMESTQTLHASCLILKDLCFNPQNPHVAPAFAPQKIIRPWHPWPNGEHLSTPRQNSLRDLPDTLMVDEPLVAHTEKVISRSRSRESLEPQTIDYKLNCPIRAGFLVQIESVSAAKKLLSTFELFRYEIELTLVPLFARQLKIIEKLISDLTNSPLALKNEVK